MIVNKKIDVNITNSNKKYYEKLLGKKIIEKSIQIDVNFLPKGSHIKVECVCDYCSSLNNIVYKNYLIQVSKNNISEICDINNLCITKRIINSIKSKLIEKEFNIK